MIVTRGIGRGIYLGAIVAVGLGLATPASVPEISTPSAIVEMVGLSAPAKKRNKSEHWPFAATLKPRFDVNKDDNEIVQILTIMSTLL